MPRELQPQADDLPPGGVAFRAALQDLIVDLEIVGMVEGPWPVAGHIHFPINGTRGPGILIGVEQEALSSECAPIALALIRHALERDDLMSQRRYYRIAYHGGAPRLQRATPLDFSG